ncbi:hypothetical protein DM01DRAFT_1315507 [Hesseltinella vesiculosa]|uniref:RRM domain-containing protein n=1 Tax=Hesseltinella vesiculosa TaxID=101127 RepID=A0A1X2GX01_9FUNG|nr:hypothetical protein DM01DRAFT_1315507 [Hesseltinella vesiculosa]
MSAPVQSESFSVYVGNLDQRVTESMLQEIFATIGVVSQVKVVVPTKRHGYNAVNYGFVDFADRRSAEQAINDMNGRKIFSHEIKVNWAQPGAQVKEDTSSHFHVFIGDLAPEVTDEMLSKSFINFGSMSEAHVMWDNNSGKSRGYGFVAFREKNDAEQAIATMNGEWLGSRAIRCNWATQKGQTATPPPQPGQQLPFEVAVHQTPAYVTSVYVGNLAPEVTQNDLLHPFQRFGFVQDIKLQADRGFAFVKMDTHENAAHSLVQLQNMTIHGRPAKLSWGKDRPPTGWQSHHHHGGYQQNWNNGQMYRKPHPGPGQLAGNPGVPAGWAQPGQQQPLYNQYNAGGHM